MKINMTVFAEHSQIVAIGPAAVSMSLYMASTRLVQAEFVATNPANAALGF